MCSFYSIQSTSGDEDDVAKLQSNAVKMSHKKMEKKKTKSTNNKRNKINEEEEK